MCIEFGGSGGGGGSGGVGMQTTYFDRHWLKPNNCLARSTLATTVYLPVDATNKKHKLASLVMIMAGDALRVFRNKLLHLSVFLSVAVVWGWECIVCFTCFVNMKLI